MSVSRFAGITAETYVARLDAPALRVKIGRWFTPLMVDEDNDRLVFDAHELASRMGNRRMKKILDIDPHAELALEINHQGVYTEPALGLLAVRSVLQPVRLETLSMDNIAHLPMVQQAQIDMRQDADGSPQVKFG